MKETWKPVEGYEGLYEVSDLGRVKSLGNGGTHKSVRVMKPTLDTYGYLKVTLHKNRKKKEGKVHRLVAFAFIPNPNNLPQVNHINEDKTDNRAVNLEWCTAGYNTNFGTRNKRISKTLTNRKDTSQAVVQLEKNGIYVNKYLSIHEADRETSAGRKEIKNCCQHKYNTAGGYRWFYLSEYEEICFKVVTNQHPFHLALSYRA